MTKYKVNIYKTDEERQTEFVSDSFTAYADSLADCRKKVSEAFETFRIYVADLTDIISLNEASLEIVKRTTANMIQREGGELQHGLYMDCRVRNIDSPDVLDMLSVVKVSLYEDYINGSCVEECYHKAYLALNRHLYASKQICLSRTAMKTLYIEDIDGEIVNVSKGINTIVNASSQLPHIEDGGAEYNKDVGEILVDLLKTFTPTQKRVIKYIANGYSERQIAEILRRAKSTIHEHKELARKKALEKYPLGIDSILEELKRG